MPSVLFVTTVAVTLDAFLLPFADRFRSHGWRVDALANGAASNEHIAPHFDERFDIEWSRNPLAPHNLLGASRRVREIVRAGRYDIVHVHTPIAAFVTRWALRFVPQARRPLVVYTAHGFHFFDGQSASRNFVFRTLEMMAAGWTDYLVTINHEDFGEALRFGRIDQHRVRYVPGIGVDIERFAPRASGAPNDGGIRAELGIDPSAFLVVMIAEFMPVKRHALAVDAIERITSDDVVVLFVGDGPLRSQVETELKRRGLTSRVRFAGYRRDVPAILAECDAGMLVSEREGLARSVLEEMATGLPVIGTATRGIVDAIGASAGWTPAEPTGPALAEAIDAAASRRDEVRRRGELARARVVEEFAIDRIVGSYEELYDEALSSRV